MFFKFQQKMAALFLAAIFLIAILDRLLKSLAINQVFDSPRQIIVGWLSLNFIPNYNIAFSIPLRGSWLNIVISAIIVILIYYTIYLLKRAAYYKASWLIMIIIGAVSNLYDRLKYGLVVDYFDLSYFTVFNLADLMIIAGVMGLVWQALHQSRQENDNSGKEKLINE